MPIDVKITPNEGKPNNNCVHCKKFMRSAYGTEKMLLPYCDYPECPNYGLLQSPVLAENKEKINKK